MVLRRRQEQGMRTLKAISLLAVRLVFKVRITQLFSFNDI